jgi:hypothetical protein
MLEVDIAITVTLWFSFAAFLIFPTLNAPPAFARMAIGLCGSELLMACAWAFSREECSDEACPRLMHTAEAAAGVQIPVMFGIVLALGLGYAVHVVRSW